jgi:hypothetical protein
MTGTDCGLKRRLPKEKGSRHGKLSSFHTGEQLLHAGGEHHAPATAIDGPTLMFRIRLAAKRTADIRAPLLLK